jgi:hypothetical protein
VKYPALILIAVLALIAAAPADPPTPPPSPPPLNQTQPSPAATASTLPTASPSVSPSASASPGDLDTIFGGHSHGKGGHRPQASGTPTPPPQTRKGLDGVWEVQIQRGPKTEYEHMNLIQTGQSLTGFYLTADKKKFPISGAVDQQNNLRLVVSLPDGSTILLDARVDGNTDMLGMFTDSKERVPFTAAYRPKEKWIENVNAAPGGLINSSGTGSGPP